MKTTRGWLLGSLVLAACGSGTMEIDNRSSLVDSTACSRDGTHSVVVGTFTQAVSGNGSTNLLILLPNCRWCADNIAQGESRALTSEGTWSSAGASDGSAGIRITKTNSQFSNLVPPDGKSVTSYRVSDGSYAGFLYLRDDLSTYTCDGQ